MIDLRGWNASYTTNIMRSLRNDIQLGRAEAKRKDSEDEGGDEQ
jgi:hypothetical protein